MKARRSRPVVMTTGLVQEGMIGRRVHTKMRVSVCVEHGCLFQFDQCKN